MMPQFRQERCAPRAPIRCHADFTSCERQHRLAQHDNQMNDVAKQGDFLGQEKLILGHNETIFGTNWVTFWDRRI